MNTSAENRLRLLPWLVTFGAVVWGTVGQAEPLHLVAPHTVGEPIEAVIVTDARPDWQKRKKFLSLNRMSCEFAITRYGDKESTPGRAQAVAEGLARLLDEVHRDKPFKLTWFTIHRNSRAAPSAEDPMEKGLAYDALHSMECRRGDEIIGGVEKAQLTPPAPLVIDIVVEVDGQAFVGRAVGSVPEANVAPVKLFDEAMSNLARNILENAPTDTPCDRLRKARNASPKVSFYKTSYREYCVQPK